jgi:hypothetical protein
MSKYLIKSLGTSIAGTAMMTLSSALMSLEGQEFREPSHLAALISRLVPTLSGEGKKISGWAAHFSMGMAFSFVYVTLWERRMVRPTLKNAVVMGLISSIIGIGIWKTTFWLHPFSPIMNYRRFYLQRIPAHLCFAIFATIGYVLTKKYFKNSHLKPFVRQSALMQNKL